ncbi:MAG: hypothetical protein N3D74_00905 [Caldisericia bacterium]|nr:hypothetical protein [Caldisericia bacterium]
MSKKLLIITLILTILVIGSITLYFKIRNAEQGDFENGEIIMKGTIKYIDLEGGFYGIVGDNGKNYLPINLSQEFKINGLRVKFEGKIRNDVMTIYMWGTPIEIIKIEIIK